jgi:hypothetical protein
VNLTTHLHLVPRSRIRGDILPLPQYAFLARCSVKRKHGGNFLPFTFTRITNSQVVIFQGTANNIWTYEEGAGNYRKKMRWWSM